MRKFFKLFGYNVVIGLSNLRFTGGIRISFLTITAMRGLFSLNLLWLYLTAYKDEFHIINDDILFADDK
jgi:hypothetical protein